MQRDKGGATPPLRALMQGVFLEGIENAVNFIT